MTPLPIAALPSTFINYQRDTCQQYSTHVYGHGAHVESRTQDVALRTRRLNESQEQPTVPTMTRHMYVCCAAFNPCSAMSRPTCSHVSLAARSLPRKVSHSLTARHSASVSSRGAPHRRVVLLLLCCCCCLLLLRCCGRVVVHVVCCRVAVAVVVIRGSDSVHLRQQRRRRRRRRQACSAACPRLVLDLVLFSSIGDTRCHGGVGADEELTCAGLVTWSRKDTC